MAVAKQWLLFLPALLAGCSFSSARTQQLPADGELIPILREKSGTYSNIEQRQRLVIHDEGAMATVPIDPGPVDFDREMVVLAALGPARSGDFGIRIRKLERRGPRLHADVEIRYPPVDAPRRGFASSPYHLIVVPRCDLNVAGFETRNAVRTARR